MKWSGWKQTGKKQTSAKIQTSAHSKIKIRRFCQYGCQKYVPMERWKAIELCEEQNKKNEREDEKGSVLPMSHGTL